MRAQIFSILHCFDEFAMIVVNFSQGRSRASSRRSNLYPSDQRLHSIPYDDYASQIVQPPMYTHATRHSTSRRQSSAPASRASRGGGGRNVGSSGGGHFRSSSEHSGGGGRFDEGEDRYTSDSPLYMNSRVGKSNSRMSAPVYSIASPFNSAIAAAAASSMAAQRRPSSGRRATSMFTTPPQQLLQPPDVPPRSAGSNRSQATNYSRGSYRSHGFVNVPSVATPSAPPIHQAISKTGGYASFVAAQPDYSNVAKFQPSMYQDSLSRMQAAAYEQMLPVAQQGASPGSALDYSTNENSQLLPRSELPKLRRKSSTRDSM